MCVYRHPCTAHRQRRSPPAPSPRPGEPRPARRRLRSRRRHRVWRGVRASGPAWGPRTSAAAAPPALVRSATQTTAEPLRLAVQGRAATRRASPASESKARPRVLGGVSMPGTSLGPKVVSTLRSGKPPRGTAASVAVAMVLLDGARGKGRAASTDVTSTLHHGAPPTRAFGCHREHGRGHGAPPWCTRARARPRPMGGRREHEHG